MMIHSHFGVYACVFDEDGKKILAIRKGRGPYKGMYDLPGGGPEPMELLEEALLREVKEETGCDLDGVKEIRAVSARFNYEKDGSAAMLRHLGVLYTATLVGTPQTHGDGKDSEGCVWADIATLKESNASPFLLEAVRKV